MAVRRGRPGPYAKNKGSDMGQASQSWGDSFQRRNAKFRGGRSRYEHDRDEEETPKRPKHRASKPEAENMNENNNNNDELNELPETAEEILETVGERIADSTRAAEEQAEAQREQAERLRRDNDRLEDAEASSNARTSGWVQPLKKVAGYSAVAGIVALAAYHGVKYLSRKAIPEEVAEVAEAAVAAFTGK